MTVTQETDNLLMRSTDRRASGITHTHGDQILSVGFTQIHKEERLSPFGIRSLGHGSVFFFSRL